MSSACSAPSLRGRQGDLFTAWPLRQEFGFGRRQQSVPADVDPSRQRWTESDRHDGHTRQILKKLGILGMDNSTVAVAAVVISAASLLLTVLQRIWGGSWGLAGKLAEMERGLRQAITDSTKEVEEKQSRASHDVGETIAAIREKIRRIRAMIAGSPPGAPT